MMSNNFGEILKNIRKENGLTQAKIGEMLGVLHHEISHIENGRRKRIDLDFVCKICNIFNISANQLLGIETKENLIPECDDNNTLQKVKKLEKGLNYVKEELKKLELQDKRVFEIRSVLNNFVIDTNVVDEMVQIYCSEGIIPLGGLFKENDMLYALILMSFFGELYYKCRKVITKIKEEECCIRIDALLLYVGMTLREQVIYDVRPNKRFQTEQFYNEFKELIETAVNSLGNITECYNYQWNDELNDIRAIYETITFKGKEIEYYDYITKTYSIVNICNTVELQYMIMNLYAKAYAESVLWLKKEYPSEQWCPTIPWKIITKMKIIIPKYFIY